MNAQPTVPRDAIPPDVLSLCESLRTAGYRAWIVGGCIRDLLRGAGAQDWDLATSATPKEVMGVFRKVVPTGIAHGTVTVVLHGVGYEVTTLRGEGAYTDGRRPDAVHFVRNIEDDLLRRDFTVNAIAYDPLTQELTDPWGGVPDLQAKVLRAVGDPAARFGEDGLRVLRAARFAATLEFTLDPATEAAIPGSLDTFRKVSAERVQQEWVKALKAKTPSVAFEVMRRTGILGVTLPALMEQVDCEQNKYHAYDVWTHTMRCLDESPKDLVVRLAAVLHDLGKPQTRARSEKTGDFTFYHHEEVGAKMADRWLKDYRFANDVRESVVHLIRQHLVCYTSEWTDAAVRRFVKRVTPQALPQLMALARADARAKGKPVDDSLVLFDELEARVAALCTPQAALSTRELAIDGKDVMAHLQIPPSRRVGELLEMLLDRVLDDPTLNEKARLLALLDELMQNVSDPNAPRG